MDNQDMKSHVKAGRVICDVCYKDFKNLKILKMHKKLHEQRVTWECEVCGVKLLGKSNFKRHKLIHDVTSLHKCDTCGKTFKLKEYLTRHRQEHQNNKDKYKCIICGKTFKWKSSLWKHQNLTKHGKTSDVFKCQLCKKTFMTEKMFNQHQLTHEERSLESSSSSGFLCSKCGRWFKSERSFIRHQKLHEKNAENYRLERFGTGKTRDILKRLGPYSCTCCGNKFRTMKLAQKHLLLEHKTYLYKCSDCGKEFISKTSYNLHQETGCNTVQPAISREATANKDEEVVSNEENNSTTASVYVPFCQNVASNSKTFAGTLNFGVGDLDRLQGNPIQILIVPGIIQKFDLLKGQQRISCFNLQCCKTSFNSKKTYLMHCFRIHKKRR